MHRYINKRDDRPIVLYLAASLSLSFFFRFLSKIERRNKRQNHAEGVRDRALFVLFAYTTRSISVRH